MSCPANESDWLIYFTQMWPCTCHCVALRDVLLHFSPAQMHSALKYSESVNQHTHRNTPSLTPLGASPASRGIWRGWTQPHPRSAPSCGRQDQHMSVYTSVHPVNLQYITILNRTMQSRAQWTQTHLIVSDYVLLVCFVRCQILEISLTPNSHNCSEWQMNYNFS